MKWIYFFLLNLIVSIAMAQEGANPFNIQVSVTRMDELFQINASYAVPVSQCSAFAFMTDYDGAKNIPGVMDAKVLSRVGNKVVVQRVIEERVLFFPVQLKSVIEYTETPNQLLSFEQLSGDTKLYKGSWRLSSDKEKTVFKYDGLVEPRSVIPSAVIEYFIKNSIQTKFQNMAERMVQKNATEVLACR